MAADPAVVQVLGTGGATSTSATVTVSPAPAATSAVVFAVKGGSGAHLTAVSDSRGNTWTIHTADTVAAAVVSVASTPQDVAPLQASDVITGTMSISSNWQTVAVECSGLGRVTTGALDVDRATSDGGSATTKLTVSDAVGVLRGDRELVLAFGVCSQAQTFSAPGGGFTKLGNPANPASIATAWQVGVFNTTYSITWTIDVARTMDASVTTFRQAGPPTPAGYRTRRPTTALVRAPALATFR